MLTTLSGFLDLPLEEKTRRGLLYTPAEIAQQPATWKTTLQIFKQHQARVAAFLDSAGVRAAVQDRPSVILIGAGTSDYISQASSFILRKQWGCEVSAVASTDLLSNTNDYIIPGRRYLWISFSRSGDSPEGVAVLEQAIAQYPEVAHLVVTCNANARMVALCEGARQGCSIVLDDAVNDRSLAMTSSFTNMIVMAQCLAHAWSISEYEPVLEQLVAAGESLLPQAAQLAESLAGRGFERICLVGGGALASVAKESALKVLEMTAGGIKTMSETVLGLRHGPMAALDTRTLFVCFVSGDPARSQYGRDLLCEIGGKQVVAERIAIGPGASKADFVDVCNEYLSLQVSVGFEDAYRPVLDVIFGQLLGLYCSVARQLKPDSPSPAGVISRVVQPFQIY